MLMEYLSQFFIGVSIGKSEKRDQANIEPIEKSTPPPHDGQKGSSSKNAPPFSPDPFLKHFTFQKYQKQSLRSVGSMLWGDAFRPNNPIHSLLSIESEMLSPSEVFKAYEKLSRILRIVKEACHTQTLEPREKLRLVYATMEALGIRFGDMDDPLLSRNLNAHQLDCDTSSFVVMAIAHEMGWPVRIVLAPNHVFVRWDDGKGVRFNMDFGEIHPDPYYIETMKIPPESLQRGIRLKNLNPAERLALFLHLRGSAKADQGRLSEAIKDYTEAIFLNPRFPDAYLDRGHLRNEMGQYPQAQGDLIQAEKLDPRYSGAVRNVEFTQRLRKILKR